MAGNHISSVVTAWRGATNGKLVNAEWRNLIAPDRHLCSLRPLEMVRVGKFVDSIPGPNALPKIKVLQFHHSCRCQVIR